MNETDIVKLIKGDKWMMQVLRTVETLKFPDWYIGAGFVRGKVWDYLHGYTKRTILPDVDVVYFNKTDFSLDESVSDSTKNEKLYELELKKRIPEVNWSVTNQARMHIFHNDKPYNSSSEAISRWVETATCIGVKLENGALVLTAPHGIEDLVNLILRPTPTSKDREHLFRERIQKKNWLKKWPRLTVVYKDK